MDHRFTPTDPEYHGCDVPHRCTVGVGSGNVNNAEELRKENSVDQVRTQVPKCVDGLNFECHHCGQCSNSEDRNTNDPDYFTLGGLVSGKRDVQDEQGVLNEQ